MSVKVPLAGPTTPGIVPAYETGSGSLGTLSWSGTAPTNLEVANYKWTRVGNLVTAQAHIEYNDPGSGNTVVSFDLPNDMPTPTASLVNSAGAPNWVAVGSGFLDIADGNGGGISDSALSALFRTSGGAFQWYIYNANATNARNAHSVISYFVD